MQEFVAADYVFKSFCEVDNVYMLLIPLITLLCFVGIFNLLLSYENYSFMIVYFLLLILCYKFSSTCFYQKNADGQTMLASTLIPQPHSMAHAPVEEDVHMSFGRFVYCMCFFFTACF